MTTTESGEAKGHGLDKEGDAITIGIQDVNLRSVIAARSFYLRRGKAFVLGTPLFPELLKHW